MSTPLATHSYTPGGLDAALEFLKRTRSELRTLRKVRLWKDAARSLVGLARIRLNGLLGRYK